MAVPGPPYDPHSGLVARAWLELALPSEVIVGEALDPYAAGIRTLGMVVTGTLVDRPGRDVPTHSSPTVVECWVAPPSPESQIVQWNAAERLASWVTKATYDFALMGRRIDFGAVLGPAFAAYSPARVHTVIALGRRRVEDDPGKYARVDVDLQINWTGV